MNILIYGLNYSPELAGIGKYTGEMAEWLAQNGHTVTVITTPPYYPEWKIDKNYSGWHFTSHNEGKITVIRCPLWVPANPATITRIIHLFSFMFSSFPILVKQIFTFRPDILFCIAPSFLCAPQAVFLSKLARVKCWLHFQDFEICAMFGSGMAARGQRVSLFLHKLQRIITRHFDAVSSISHAMCDSAEKQYFSPRKIVLFPNWVDNDFITPSADGMHFRRHWNIPAEKKVILYSGNLGKKQGLESILEAAQALQERDDLLFLIVGDGAHKSFLLKKYEEKKINNVQFYPLQPYHLLPSLLRTANIHLVMQKRGAADSVLPSKLTSILSAGGHCIITADKDTELGRITHKHPGIATLIPPEDTAALVRSITQLCEDPAVSSNTVNISARQYAIEQLGKDAILKRFEKELRNLTDICH